MRSVAAATLLLLAGASLPAQTPAGRAYVIERSHSHARFEANGTGALSVGVRVRVESEAGVEAFGELIFPYASANERINVDSVLVRKVGGGVVVATASNEQDLSAPVAQTAPMYSDLRQKVVTVPGLRPGDTLEYRVTWTIHTPLAPGHFWRNFEFIRNAVVLDERITLDVPTSKPVQVKSLALEPQVAEAGDRRVYRWQSANLQVDTAAMRRGVLRPMTILVTTFRSWDELGSWYAELQRDRAAPTPRIRAVADSLVRGQRTRDDSIAALYRFVATEVRYVSLSFGVGRYQPHPAADVLANRYGDCKDKHVLLEALLTSIGVRAAPVLISSDTDVEPAVPSPAQFDHMITRIATGRDSIWLDATPGVAPYRLLVFPLRDKLALVMPPGGDAHLARTPANPPFAAYDSIGVTGEVTDLGAVQVAVSYVMRGDVEVLLRTLVRQVPRENWPQFTRGLAISAGFVGTPSAPQASDPTVTTEPFVYGFRLERSTPATWLDRRADFWLPLPRMQVDSQVTDTVVLGPPMRHVVYVSLQLPVGVTARLPLPVSTSRAYADYRSSYSLNGRTLTARRELTVKQARLGPPLRGAYATLRRLIRDDEAQSVTLIRASDPPAATASTANVDDLHARGLAALRNRDGQGAARLFREVVRLAPEHRDGWTNLGRAYMEQRLPDSAAAAFRKQIALSPDEAYGHNNLGWALRGAQRLNDAVGAFQRALELSPLDEYAHAALGRVYLEQQRDSAAAESLERATKLTPDDASLYVDLGKAYGRLKQADGALAAFTRAVELAPQISTWNSAAYGLAEGGVGLDQAEEWARRAVAAAAEGMRDAELGATGPQLSNAFLLSACWDTMGWVFYRKGDLVRAERYVRAAWLMRGTGEIGLHLGEIYEKLGRRNDARQHYAMAAGGWTPSAEARRRLTAIVGSADRATEAINAARVVTLDQRTFKLGKATSDVNLTVEVLVTPKGITQVRRESGADLTGQLARDIRAVRVGVLFPDTTAVRIPRHASVMCSTGGECQMILFDFGGTEASRRRISP